MRKAALAVMAVLCAVPAHAHGEASVPDEACKYLAAHRPVPGVAYEPGVDVNGRPVVEADITPPVAAMPKDFSFDVTVDLAAHLGLQQAMPGLEGHVKAGTMKFENGTLSFNGQPLEGPTEAELRALCGAGQPAAGENLRP